MRLSDETGRDLGRLCYCANVHPGESLDAAIEAARTHAKAVKAAVSPDAPMGYGLRLTAAATQEAARDPARLSALRDALEESGLDAFTVNGFPFGAFHGVRVKEAVYRPDWRAPERLAYSCALADVMAALTEDASLSTVPGGYRPDGRGHEVAIAENYLRFAAHAARLADRTGRIVRLAIEPEPECLFETTAEAIAFFEAHLFTEAATSRLGALAGLSTAAAAEALPRHLGLCFDVCHAAVAFEDPVASLDALEAAGVPVHKLQLSAALTAPRADAAARAALAAFDEPTYLHQVVARGPDGRLRRHVDLGAALAEAAADPQAERAAAEEAWRVHFHVPVFAETAPPFESTQAELARVLDRHRRRPICAHLEIETYTFDVLPDAVAAQAGPVEAMIARELAWARARLSSAPSERKDAR